MTFQSGILPGGNASLSEVRSRAGFLGLQRTLRRNLEAKPRQRESPDPQKWGWIDFPSLWTAATLFKQRMCQQSFSPDLSVCGGHSKL